MSYNDSSYLRNSSGVIINTNADRQITEARQKKEKERTRSAQGVKEPKFEPGEIQGSKQRKVARKIRNNSI